MYIFPQVLIVDLCADKFLQEVSEITVPVTHGYVSRKSINGMKLKQEIGKSWYACVDSSGSRNISRSFLIKREGNRLTNLC